MNKQTDFFGNKGEELFVVPISFARKGTLFHFDLPVAANDEDEAREVAAKISETAVGQIYFSADRFAHADEETILSILKSIEGVSNVDSERTGEDDFDFCVDENEADQVREDDDEFVGDGDHAKEEETDGELHPDTFGNYGKHLYHVPMKYGIELDDGAEAMVYFEVEVAADDKDEAVDCANDISWNELVNGMDIDASSEKSLIGSFEELAGVITDTVMVTECVVAEEDYETLQVDDGAEEGVHLAEDEESDEGEEEESEEEDEDDEICEDDFGNEGEKFWWVPMEFAMETFELDEADEGNVKKFTFHLKIAADNEEDAVNRAGEVALHDITGDADDDECFCDMTEDDIVGDLNTQYDSTCDADWEDSDMTFYLRVNEDEDVEECF